MAQGANQKLNFRVNLVLVLILLLGFGAAICRIAFLQLIKGEELQNKAVEQQLSDTVINSERGTIYDRNGKVLAKSASVWKVILAPAYFQNDEQRAYVSKELAEILGLNQEDVLAKTKENSQYIILKRRVETEQREKILKLISDIDEKYQLANVITLADDFKRYYPYGDLASSVIGFTGSDDQGLSGVEYQYDEYLTGTKGRLVTAQNANGTEMPFQYSQNIEAEDGNSLVLTIDETIQSIVEKHLQQAVIDYAVYNRSVCIVMDVNTGELLAMATVEGYDLNDPFTLSEKSKDKIKSVDENYLISEKKMDLTGKSNDEIKELISKTKSELESSELSKMWRNKAVSDTYYPGSVWKIITSAMALQEGLINDNTRFHCNGYAKVYGEDINCHNRSGHGTQTFAEAIMHSCNPAFISIGEMIGTEKFWEYYQAFGLSEKTGIDLPGESEDLFFSEDGSMGPMDLAVAAFGQNFSITPIQMITAVSAVANGGNLVQPHVVKQIIDYDGNVVETVETKIKRQVVSPEVSEILNGILEENTISGGAQNGYVSGYRVTGKTGTSEKKIDVDGDGVDDYIASFCGYAPADNPQIAVLVFFDAPTAGSYYGSQVAAPVFAKIMNEVLPYMEVETQYTDEEMKNLDTVAESYIGYSVEDAEKAIKDAELNVLIQGDGDTVISQIPKSGSAIPKNGTVVLYTDEESTKQQVAVPDFTGLGIYDVNYLASLNNLNVSFSGTFTADGCTCASQEIQEGSMVSPGTVIKVSFVTSGIND